MDNQLNIEILSTTVFDHHIALNLPISFFANHLPTNNIIQYHLITHKKIMFYRFTII